jgi:hypothetical protein
MNYSASQLNDSNGNRILPNVSGTYAFWVDENIVYYVPNHKILGGYFMPYVSAFLLFLTRGQEYSDAPTQKQCQRLKPVIRHLRGAEQQKANKGDGAPSPA